MKITPEMLAKSGSEHGEQCALFCWANENIDKYPDLKWMFAIPNGGLRNKIVANNMKAEGVKSGVPDICLLVRRGEYSCLWIELKRCAKNGKYNGKVSDNQKEWLLQASKECGHKALVAFGWKDARDAILRYLEKNK